MGKKTTTNTSKQGEFQPGDVVQWRAIDAEEESVRCDMGYVLRILPQGMRVERLAFGHNGRLSTAAAHIAWKDSCYNTNYSGGLEALLAAMWAETESWHFAASEEQRTDSSVLDTLSDYQLRMLLQRPGLHSLLLRQVRLPEEQVDQTLAETRHRRLQEIVIPDLLTRLSFREMLSELIKATNNHSRRLFPLLIERADSRARLVDRLLWPILINFHDPLGRNSETDSDHRMYHRMADHCPEINKLDWWPSEVWPELCKRMDTSEGPTDNLREIIRWFPLRNPFPSLLRALAETKNLVQLTTLRDVLTERTLTVESDDLDPQSTGFHGLSQYLRETKLVLQELSV